jgi:hypothetical protein
MNKLGLILAVPAFKITLTLTIFQHVGIIRHEFVPEEMMIGRKKV